MKQKWSTNEALVRQKLSTSEADKVFGKKTNDHRILDAALNLQLIEKNATVVLVSKDINLRLKAKALNLPAEDYLTGKVKDMKFAYSGKTTIDDLEASVIRKMYVSGSTKKLSALGDARANNHFYIMKNCSSSALGYFNESKKIIERVDKGYAYGV